MDEPPAAALSHTHADRTLFMLSLRAPPLPLLCRNSVNGEEVVSNSHDLIAAIAGRLIVAIGSDWFLDSLQHDDKEEQWQSPTPELQYERWCTYTR